MSCPSSPRGVEEAGEGHHAVAVDVEGDVTDALGQHLVAREGRLGAEEVHHAVEGGDGDEAQEGGVVQVVGNLNVKFSLNLISTKTEYVLFCYFT